MGDGFQSRADWQGTLLAGWACVCAYSAGVLVESKGSYFVYAWAWVFTALWVLGSAQLLWAFPWAWERPAGRLVLAGFTMVFGILALLVHIWLALNALGGHAAAVEHTSRTAGVGWGVYVNYLFTAVWLADTIWLTAATRSYARRPRWMGYAVHGFLAFVVFNATVVYGEPATRLAGGVWFAILGFSWWRRTRFAARRASEGRAPPG